jgi:Uncharacterised nucleotidyltransferase
MAELLYQNVVGGIVSQIRFATNSFVFTGYGDDSLAHANIERDGSRATDLRNGGNACYCNAIATAPALRYDRREKKGAIMSEAVVVGWERALLAAEKVKERLRRATKALDGAGVPYAVVGGNAVAEWVARIDDEAVRNTKDVDLLVRRADFAAVQTALETAGFVYHHQLDIDVFIDGPHGKPSGGVHLLFAGEKGTT